MIAEGFSRIRSPTLSTKIQQLAEKMSKYQAKISLLNKAKSFKKIRIFSLK